MPVIQIDKNGFIKGTKRKFVMKVIVKKAMMIKGAFVPVGSIMDLEGAFLAECLSYNKVEPAPINNEAIEQSNDETTEEPKKLGPKKRKSKKE